MQRLSTQPRIDWQQAVTALGLTWHTHNNGTPYWDESACYSFTSAEVDMLEEATNDLHQLCLRTVAHVIATNRFAELGIPDVAVPWIVRSWHDRMPTLYGRLDLAYDGRNPPRLLEYNADTPTSLLEAAVVQWYWLQAVRPKADQFNSVWESLTARWQQIRAQFLNPGETVTMAYTGAELAEDHMTVTCVMQETAKEAGIASQCIPIKQLGWDDARDIFVDLRDMPIRTVFKLYP